MYNDNRQQQQPPAPPYNQGANYNQGYGNTNDYANAPGGGYHATNPYQGAGYGQQPPPPFRNRGPPPGADPRLWQFFSNVDANGSGVIDLYELQRALINSNWSEFDLDTIKMLMGMFDTDRSGTIGYNEFASLFKYIEEWQKVFRHWDTDRSGTIQETELTNALNGFGYNLPPHLVRLLVLKYSSNQAASAHGEAQSVSFDRFVRACVAVKELTQAFRTVDSDNDGWIQLNYNQFMDIFLKAP